MARISKEDFRKEPAPTRKRRKPMTEEQRAAAAERLAKAREESTPMYWRKTMMICYRM
jgi:hypothetical protein